MLEDRITELEIKFSHQDHLVNELNQIISNQQLSIDRLIKEIQDLKLSVEGSAQSSRTLEDDVPPHY
jgi:SlyX protein